MTRGIQVKRRKLPVKFLDRLDEEVRAEFHRLLGLARQSIQMELKNAPADLESALPIISSSANASIEPLRQSLHNRRAMAELQALRDYQRRLDYGAPLSPVQVPESVVRDVVEKVVPWTDDWILFDQARARKPLGPAQKPEEEVVPLSQIVGLQPLSALELTNSLKWQGLIVLLKHEGENVYSVIQGSGYVLAAMITRLPAVQAVVWHVPSESTKLEGRVESLDWVVSAAQVLTDPYTYRVPSLLEPVADLARQWTTEDEFLAAATGVEAVGLQEVREQSKQKDAEVVAAWVVQDARSFQQKESVAEGVAKRLREEVAQSAARRFAFVRGWKQATMFAKEDGLESLNELDWGRLWVWARKATIMKQQPTLVWGFTPGQQVEVRNIQGEWVGALVDRIDGPELRVVRADGQYRMVRSGQDIRPLADIDTTADSQYISSMSIDLTIPEFNVVIPAGSNSYRIEKELEPVTAELNSFALPVSKTTWERSLDILRREYARLEAECRVKTEWDEFRPNAAADCIRVFFEQRGLPVQRINKKTQTPAMDKETLQALAAMGDDLANLVIEAREARSKLSQLEAWAEYAEAGEVQPNWNQLGTPMGRYSCASPNLQNRITEIRETIEAPEGYRFVSLDLGQAEYVTWASLSGDPLLSKAFLDGTDFHLMMIDQVREAAPSVDLHEKDPRKSGKTINFALLYQMKAFALAKMLGLTTEEAQQLIDAYAQRAPLATAYVQQVLAEARRTGQVSTKFGRVRFMPEMRKSLKPAEMHEASKTAWHHHNAGTAAELLKIKQVKVWKALRKQWTSDQVRMVLQMHDEIVLLVKVELVQEVVDLALAKFQEPIQGFLPFKVDCRTGRNWLEVSK